MLLDRYEMLGRSDDAVTSNEPVAVEARKG